MQLPFGDDGKLTRLAGGRACALDILDLGGEFQVPNILVLQVNAERGGAMRYATMDNVTEDSSIEEAIDLKRDAVPWSS
jgi:hypothetical protein